MYFFFPALSTRQIPTQAQTHYLQRHFFPTLTSYLATCCLRTHTAWLATHSLLPPHSVCSPRSSVSYYLDLTRGPFFSTANLIIPANASITPPIMSSLWAAGTQSPRESTHNQQDKSLRGTSVETYGHTTKIFVVF